MPETVHQATINFMFEVFWKIEIEPQLRLLGVRTDKEVEGPTR